MLRTLADRADIIDEMIDRFGEIPDSVMTLLDVSHLRAMCTRFGVSVAVRQPLGVLFRFDMRYVPDLNQLSEAMEGSQIRFSAARIPGLFLPLSVKTSDADALKIACGEMLKLTQKMDEIEARDKAKM